mmetsp:Transcript_49936/g.106227  ORF Transcript_49936/g.106227 Transcript_49936/m.106227 type:complete len:113 (-) Transcript_49936:48-386(-)
MCSGSTMHTHIVAITPCRVDAQEVFLSVKLLSHHHHHHHPLISSHCSVAHCSSPCKVRSVVPFSDESLGEAARECERERDRARERGIKVMIAKNKDKGAPRPIGIGTHTHVK